MSFLQADCSLVDSPSRLLLNLLLIKKTCYHKNVPLLLCLSCKQTVHTSFRYYKNVPLLLCLTCKQPVPLSRIGRFTSLLNSLIHINFCSFSNIIFVSLLQNVYLCNQTKAVTHIKSGDLL